MSTQVQPENELAAAPSIGYILSAARTLIVSLGRQARGAIVWCVNLDGTEGRDVPILKAASAKRDLVREAMMDCDLGRTD
jgi:hypothetical protein